MINPADEHNSELTPLEQPQPDQPPEETQPAEIPPATAAEETEPSQPVEKPSLVKRFLRFLFNPETRLGRGMRAVVRALALAVVFFAGGFLVAYLLLYQPANEALENSQSKVRAVQTQQFEIQANLNLARADLNELKNRYQDAQDQATIQQTRIHILTTLGYAQAARLSLSIPRDELKTNPAGKDLSAASAALSNALPVIEKKDADLAKSLKSRMELILVEAERDPKTALADLNILIETLQLIDKTLGG